MKIGVHLANGGVWATPETIVGLAERAEALGLDSVWVSDHVVVPSAIESPYPYGPPATFSPEASQNYFEPFGVLAYVAGRTRRIELGTTVLVLPQRQPLLVAKQWATLDALSGGRTILGIGAGWMREEFIALGADTFDRRGPATDEALAILRAAWSEAPEIAFAGTVYQFEPIRALPKPARPGGPPIWIGGHGRRSIRRAAELGDGWHPIRIPLDELRTATATLYELLPQYGRRPEDVTLSTVVTAWAPGTHPDGPDRDWALAGDPDACAEKLHRYQDAGIQHVVVNAFPRDRPSAMLETLDFLASEVRPRLDAL
ncbi:MAG: LLM class F420-dependent oxidoreductase [Chloroflexi bacterium]|nr:LLM class F420-dependent oxidoreductase [Chloroflexota bacterium]